ncbi:MAG TPA: hypothetical protein VM869_17795 [Enhygromyxa sp.]|nr:hypothetical protein [Enhygromyxa sp.]
MAVDTVRVRSVDNVVIAFFEPDLELTTASAQRWFEAAELPGASISLILTVGPLSIDPELRRAIVATLERVHMRVVAVTDNRLNRGLIGTFGWLGVSVSTYPWSQLDEAARDVASRPELIAPIVRAARALRAESPAAAGLEPDEG